MWCRCRLDCRCRRNVAAWNRVGAQQWSLGQSGEFAQGEWCAALQRWPAGQRLQRHRDGVQRQVALHRPNPAAVFRSTGSAMMTVFSNSMPTPCSRASTCSATSPPGTPGGSGRSDRRRPVSAKRKAKHARLQREPDLVRQASRPRYGQQGRPASALRQTRSGGPLYSTLPATTQPAIAFPAQSTRWPRLVSALTISVPGSALCSCVTSGRARSSRTTVTAPSRRHWPICVPGYKFNRN